MARENNLKPIAEESEQGMATFTPNAYTQDIWDFLMSFIGNEIGVAGLMGNLYWESSCYPNMLYGDTAPPTSLSIDYTANVDNGTTTRQQFISSRAYGLAQWLSSGRKANLYDAPWVQGGSPPSPSNSIGSLNRGLNMIKYELTQGYYQSTLTYLQNATDLDSATNRVFVYYEGAGDNTLGVRQELAGQIYSKYGSGQQLLYISVSRNGNGTIAVSNYLPQVGEIITLECIPASGETLLDIQAWTIPSHYSVALAVTETQTFPMPNESIEIIATFSGTTPTPPEPPQPPTSTEIITKRLPIWMYPRLRRKI